MVPPGTDGRVAYEYLRRLIGSLRDRALVFVGIGTLMTILGGVGLVEVLTDSDPDAYSALKGVLVLVVLGMSLLGYGILRLARLTRD
jgi:hypothetical protein